VVDLSIEVEVQSFVGPFGDNNNEDLLLSIIPPKPDCPPITLSIFIKLVQEVGGNAYRN
jgi:hypothetical protein